MTWQRLDPIATGTSDTWALEFGSDKVSATNWPHDDLTSCIAKSDGDGYQTFYVEAMPAAAGVIDQVDIGYRGYRYAGSAQTCRHYWKMVGLGGLDCGSDHAGASWADFAAADISRPGAGTWLPTDWGNAAGKCEAGVGGFNWAASNGYRVTTIWFNVEYRPTDGGFAYLIGQWLPPILAVASHCLSKSEIARILSSLKSRPSNDEDFARIIEAFKRRPAWV